MKSQKNRLENDIASLEKRLDEDNLSETEKNQTLDELAARKTTKRRNVYSQNKRRDYTIESPLVQRGEKNMKYFLNLEKRHLNKKKLSKVYSCQIIVSLKKMTKS